MWVVGNSGIHLVLHQGSKTTVCSYYCNPQNLSEGDTITFQDDDGWEHTYIHKP